MLTVKLILERLDREGRLLEKREQMSRSFVKNFIGLLYIAHAQIPSASPYSMTDIDGVAQDIDTSSHSFSHYSKGNLKIGSCGGAGGVNVPAPYDPSYARFRPDISTLPGDKIGIQVGRGTTEVTPTDTKLENRIYHGGHGIDASPVLYTCYNVGDDEDGHHAIYPDYQEGQSFQVHMPLHLTSVKLRVFRTGSPGNMTVAIQKGDADGEPDGVDLGTKDVNCDAISAASPGEWVTWTFAASIAVEPWTTYCIVVRGGVNSSNCLNWRNDGSLPTYERGMLLYSSNGGSSWSSSSADDYMFEVWGQVESGEEQLEYGGCELLNITFSDPNGEFTIRRYFTNASGSSITVNEVGIYGGGTQFPSNYGAAFAFLIARDIVTPGVAVADGEILRVTYVPQITV